MNIIDKDIKEATELDVYVFDSNNKENNITEELIYYINRFFESVDGGKILSLRLPTTYTGKVDFLKVAYDLDEEECYKYNDKEIVTETLKKNNLGIAIGENKSVFFAF